MAALTLASCGKKPRPDAKVGDTMPTLAVTTLDGAIDSVLNSGKVTMVLFFATWCPYCVVELPKIQEIYNELKDSSRFALAVISREQPAEDVKKFWEDSEYTMPVYLDKKREAYSLFAQKSIPRLYLIDENRKVAYEALGSFETQGALDTMKMCLYDLLK